METVGREDIPDRESGFERVQKARYRPARLIGLLLILQAAGLVGTMALQFSQVGWWIQLEELSEVSRQEAEALGSILFIPTAALALLAGLSLLILARRGWLLAAISQGLCLGICLWLYSGITPAYVYPVMVSCVVLIFYLNSRTVRTLFRPDQARRTGDRQL